MVIRWNDPFRVVLVISLVVLAGWVIVHSGAPDAAAPRTRAGDVDQGESTGILVSVDDDSPFDLPFDELVSDTSAQQEDAGAAPSDDAARSTRRTTGAGGTARQPATDGGGTSLPPADTGGAGSQSPATGGTNEGGSNQGANGVGHDDGPIVDPGHPGHPGTPGTPGVPGVELPVPALSNPAGTNGTGHGVGVVAPEAPLQLRSVTALAPVAAPVVDPLVDPIDATLAALLG